MSAAASPFEKCAERFGRLAAEERVECVVRVEDAAVSLMDEDGTGQSFAEVAQAEGVLRVFFLFDRVAKEAVLPFALRRVERGVGVMRELEERCAVLGRGGVAERDRERFFCALIAERLRVRRELREEFVRARPGRLRQEHRELVAALARDDGFFTEGYVTTNS